MRKLIPDEPGNQRAFYCLRRFVTAFPLWDEPGLRTVGAAQVGWWLRDRMPSVVPVEHRRWCPASSFPENGRRVRRLLPSALRATLSRWCGLLLGSSSPAEEGLVTTTPLSLLYPARENLDVGGRLPLHCAIFFRHYFREDALEWVRDMSEVFFRSNSTVLHVRQLWDYCKDFWLFLAPQSRTESLPEVATRIHEETCWDWLLEVYRRQGGGGVMRSPCNKALTALMHMQRTALVQPHLPRPPARSEYASRIRGVAACEEGHVSLVRNSRRTYHEEECQRLLAACRTNRDRVLLLLLQRVGLRNHALRTLWISDVADRDAATEGSWRPRYVAQALEKGNTMRHFCMDPVLQESVITYLREDFPAGVDPACTRLFPRDLATNPAEPWTASQIHWWFRKLCRAGGVTGPHATMHQFRHYLVTRLMAHPDNKIEDVSQWLGHAHVGTTCAHYWVVDVRDIHRRLVFPWQ